MNYLSFNDLVARGIVANRVTLGRWIRDQGFPAGRLLGPNSRRWPEHEIDAWLAARPQVRKGDVIEAA
jgi:predicted DNA-binding transcriptional regulator AlpA